MKRFVWIIVTIVMISVVISGCSRAKRIANDVDWVVFDGQPSREN
jgi:predicted small secreted protein